jgi:hypothetical protein
MQILWTKLVIRKYTLARVIDPSQQSTQRHGVSRSQRIELFRANLSATSSKTWADKMVLPTPSRLFRYVFQNIQGLPVNPRARKYQHIGDAFAETEADIFGMAELNLNLRNMRAASQFKERFQHL